MPEASFSPARQHGLALAGILGLSVLGYGFLLRPGLAPYSQFSDFITYGIGAKTVFYESLHAGRGLPFWRSDELSGNPALTNPANAYMCPLNALFWFWPPLKAVGPTLWLYFLTAGVVGYVSGCALGTGMAARLLMASALMFQFKLIMLAYAGWLFSFPVIVVMPLLYVAVFYAIEKPGAAGALLVGLVGALCLQAGQMQVFYYSVLCLSCLIAVCMAKRRREGKGVARELATLAGGAALAAGFSAYLLVPLALDAPWISRGRASYGFFLSGHALGWRHLLTFLYPEALGTPLDGSYARMELWEDAAYFGVVPLFLAVVGAVLARRRPLVQALAAVFFISAAVAFNATLQKLLFGFMPGFRLFRLPIRFLFIAGWSGIALAGFGLDEISRRLAERFPRPLFALGAAGLIALIAAEGSWYARRYLAVVPQKQLLPETDYQRFFAGHGGVYRIIPLDRATINYGWAAPMKLELATGNDSLNYRHYQTYCDLLRWGRVRPEGARVWTDIQSISRPDMLDALNVRYLVARQPAALPRDRFTLSAHLQGQPVFEVYRGFSRSDMYIYANRAVLPRAFFAERTVFARDEDEALKLLQRTDAHTTAVIETQNRKAGSKGKPADRVEVLEAYGGHLDLRTRSQETRYVIVSEIWHPGWHAFLDGRELELHKTDIALMGAWIPPGGHRIALRFSPAGWSLGLVLTALSVTLGLALFAGAWV